MVFEWQKSYRYGCIIIGITLILAACGDSTDTETKDNIQNTVQHNQTPKQLPTNTTKSAPQKEEVKQAIPHQETKGSEESKSNTTKKEDTKTSEKSTNIKLAQSPKQPVEKPKSPDKNLKTPKNPEQNLETPKSDKQKKKKEIKKLLKQLDKKQVFAGSITMVSKKEPLVIMSIGRKNGVAKGQRYIVYRGKKPIALIAVEDVFRDIATARIVKSKKKIKENDKIRRKKKK